jgi:hypothetical protein
MMGFLPSTPGDLGEIRRLFMKNSMLTIAHVLT